MITTGSLKRKSWGEPQKMNILTTDKVKPKSREDILAGLRTQQANLAQRIKTFAPHKVGGKMLVTGGMEGRVQNEKRKRLMALLKTRKEMVVIRAKIAATKASAPQPPVIPDYIKEEPTDWKIAPEKKKRGRPKKEDKETE